MTPMAFRAGGKNEVLTFAFEHCVLGEVLVAASKKGVAAIMIGDDRARLTAELQKIFPNTTLAEGDRQFKKTVAHVVDLVEYPERPLDLLLDIRGTAFQQCVWKALRSIPLGTTATYTDIADKIGNPKAVRAVARACATNLLAILVPCHRVVQADGNMAGYRWGIERKRILLECEFASGKKPARRG